MAFFYPPGNEAGSRIPWNRAFSRAHTMASQHYAWNHAFLSPEDHNERRKGLKRTFLGTSIGAGNFSDLEIQETDSMWDDAYKIEKAIYQKEKKKEQRDKQAAAKKQAVANTQKAKAVQQCAAAKKQAAKDAARAQKCNITKLEVLWHSGQDVKTTVLPAPVGRLEVLAGQKNTTNTVTFNLSGTGPCDVHKNFVFRYAPGKGCKAKKTCTDTKLEIELRSPVPNGWFGFQKKAPFPPTLPRL